MTEVVDVTLLLLAVVLVQGAPVLRVGKPYDSRVSLETLWQ